MDRRIQQQRCRPPQGLATEADLAARLNFQFLALGPGGRPDIYREIFLTEKSQLLLTL